MPPTPLGSALISPNAAVRALVTSSRRGVAPASLRWWLIVGWDSSNAPVRSQTQASPPGWLATSDISLSRTGSARAFSSGAIWPACSADNGSCASGGQHAAGLAGPSKARDFDIDLY